MERRGGGGRVVVVVVVVVTSFALVTGLSQYHRSGLAAERSW